MGKPTFPHLGITNTDGHYLGGQGGRVSNKPLRITFLDDPGFKGGRGKMGWGCAGRRQHPAEYYSKNQTGTFLIK